MNFLAALLLVWLPREDAAYGALTVLMRARGLRSLYASDLAMLQASGNGHACKRCKFVHGSCSTAWWGTDAPSWHAASCCPWFLAAGQVLSSTCHAFGTAAM